VLVDRTMTATEIEALYVKVMLSCPCIARRAFEVMLPGLAVVATVRKRRFLQRGQWVSAWEPQVTDRHPVHVG
jgi:hypothetical protein